MTVPSVAVPAEEWNDALAYVAEQRAHLDRVQAIAERAASGNATDAELGDFSREAYQLVCDLSTMIAPEEVVESLVNRMLAARQLPDYVDLLNAAD